MTDRKQTAKLIGQLIESGKNLTDQEFGSLIFSYLETLTDAKKILFLLTAREYLTLLKKIQKK